MARATPILYAVPMRSILPLLALFAVSARAADLTRDVPKPAPFKTVGSVQTAILESTLLTPSRSFDTLIPSWNVETPLGSSSVLEVRAYVDNHWTRYYSFGKWSSTSASSSVNGQTDADGTLSTDTLRLKRPATQFQYRLTLQAKTNLSLPKATLLTFSTDSRALAPTQSAEGNRSSWGKTLDVPERSQMVFKAGEGWCSPTSLSMVLAFWGFDKTVPEVAARVFDSSYGGTGNWPFNTAYAASLGLEAYVTRLPGIGTLEEFIAQGVPVITSIGFKAGEIKGAPVAWSEGHLLVVVGFDKIGNVVVNDPAGKNEDEVRRIYSRAEFERAWMGHSRGTVYLLSPRAKQN